MRIYHSSVDCPAKHQNREKNGCGRRFFEYNGGSTGTSPYRSGAVSYGEGETGTAPRRRESSGCSETEIRNLVTIQ